MSDAADVKVTMTVDAVQTSGLDAAPSTDLIVDAWFVETFHNLALPTELQNRLADARERLKAKLRGDDK